MRYWSNSARFEHWNSIEHQPRILLKAIQAGIPIITTTACGLEKRENLTIIPIGNYKALKEATENALSKSNLLIR